MPRSTRRASAPSRALVCGVIPVPAAMAGASAGAFAGARAVAVAGALAVAFAVVSAVAAAAPSESIAARQEGVWRVVSATDLARALGAPLEARDGVLTMRAASGVLIAFAGSPDALWQAAGSRTPEDVAAVIPVSVVDGVWYLPEDLVGVLGVWVGEHEVTLPSGAVRPLALERPPPPLAGGRSEVVELGPGVDALRFYADAPAGPATVSLLALDLGLLSLAFPEQREALDARLRELQGDKVLLLVITSLAEAAWDPAIYVEQDGVEVLLRSPLAVQVLHGDPERLRPGAPVVAAAFLPGTFDLRRPIVIGWAGARGSLTLRR